MKMKITVGIAFIIVMIAIAAKSAGPSTNAPVVNMRWKVPASEVQFWIRVYSSPSALAPKPWTVLTNLPSTQTNITLTVTNTACWYYITCVATNENGLVRESDPTNVGLDPWPPQGDSLEIGQ